MAAYEYAAPGGKFLDVTLDNNDGGATLGLSRRPDGISAGPSPSYMWIRPADCQPVAAGVAAALYEATGRPAPIILDRPKLTGPVLDVTIDRFRLYRTGRGRVGVEPQYPHGAEMTTGEARGHAARVAAFADLLDEAEQDRARQANVERLAAMLRCAMTETRNPIADFSFEQLARTLIGRGCTVPGGEF